MISLTDVFEVSSVLGDPDIDVDLRALIGFRAWHMCVEHECTIGDGVRLFVVQAGDTPEVINEAVGWPLTGPSAEEPSFLSIEDHRHYFEMAFAPDHDAHTRIFVENNPGTELGIHHMCLAHFWPDSQRTAP